MNKSVFAILNWFVVFTLFYWRNLGFFVVMNWQRLRKTRGQQQWWKRINYPMVCSGVSHDDPTDIHIHKFRRLSDELNRHREWAFQFDAYGKVSKRLIFIHYIKHMSNNVPTYRHSKWHIQTIRAHWTSHDFCSLRPNCLVRDMIG